ncbi:hypothetical protein EJ03DRAFT_360578 [Teratosphaeria nubilosa]|uniref:Uncharacterized protein n=1 Tax=Teratosphaeria nubilosa TaxID=161662 RepID=A0A6G1LD19_9PEZI|nr:hypothetical protein EJ03DRAFT_360578 [Teratosphaeria nubilosa]
MKTPLYVGNGVFSSVKLLHDKTGTVIRSKHSDWRWASLAPYRGYNKLFGERKYAKASPCKITFLSLPPEFRNAIYELHFIFNEPIEFLPLSPQTTRKGPYRVYVRESKHYYTKIQPALRFLRTCKLIHREASSIYYGENDFRFSGADGAHFARAFMLTIGQSNAALLRKIMLPIHFSGHSTIAAFGTLKELNLVLPSHYSIYKIKLLEIDMPDLKIKIVHLFLQSWLDLDKSQRPLRLTKMVGPKSRMREVVVEEFESVGAYAKAKEWGYDKVICGDFGGWQTLADLENR